MNDRKQFRLGLVGYGEIGSTLGEGFRGTGLQRIASYDNFAIDGPYAGLIPSGVIHVAAMGAGTAKKTAE